MTIEELQLIENDYKQRTPCFLNNQIMDELAFLSEGHIKIQSNCLNKYLRQELSKWNLTKFEMLILLCFLGNLSRIFRRSSYQKLKEPIKSMCEALDTVLLKAPVHFDNKKLYRYLVLGDRTDLSEGEIFTCRHYMNASTINLHPDDNHYIITPKDEGSNARDLYKIRDKLGECQVTFRRDTKFKVGKIIRFKDRKDFFLKEI